VDLTALTQTLDFRRPLRGKREEGRDEGKRILAHIFDAPVAPLSV